MKTLIISTIGLIFLIASVAFLAPIKTAEALSAKPVKLKISDDQKEIQLGDWKLQIENATDTYQKIIVNSPNGTTAEMTITQIGDIAEITVNGIKTEIDLAAIKTSNLPPPITPTTPTAQTQGQTIDEIIQELRQAALDPNSSSRYNTTPPTLAMSTGSIPVGLGTGGSGTATLAGFDPNHVAYSWYGHSFVDGKYPHNDKVHYGINVNSNFIHQENGIIAFMASKTLTDDLPAQILSFTIADIFASILVELLIPYIGWLVAVETIVTIILADVIAAIIWHFAKQTVIDEGGNLWFWLSAESLAYVQYYLSQNSGSNWADPLTWPGHIAAIASGFWNSAYFRIGPQTIINGRGVDEPIAPQYYGKTVKSTYNWQQNTASISNSGGITGRSPNNDFAKLYAGSNTDMAYIVTQLNTGGGGKVYINAYSDPGYNSRMLVYVSADNFLWHLQSDRYISSSTPTYYDCGSTSQACLTEVNYVLVLAWNSGSQASLRVDSVQLINNPKLTVKSFYDFGGGFYDEFNGVQVTITSAYGNGGYTRTTLKLDDGLHNIRVDYNAHNYNYGYGGPLQYIVDTDSGQYYYFYTLNGMAHVAGLNLNHDTTLCLVYQ